MQRPPFPPAAAAADLPSAGGFLTVRFLRALGHFQPGQTALVAPEQARRWAAAGIAQIVQETRHIPGPDKTG